jgi:subtilisin-like proprotein convertase family protein
MRLHLVVPVVLLLCLATTAALAGGPIVSGTTVAGNIAGPSYLESWTFSATAGNRVIATAVTTGGLLNTTIILKAPGGGVIVSDTGSGDRLDFQVASTGTYTMEVQDYGLNDVGTYALAFTNITAGALTGGGDTDGGAIGSSEVKTGTISGPADFDAFTFTGTMGNRVLIDAIATAGAGYNTVITLYPPAGAGYLTYTTGDRLEAQLSASGTWTVVIEDNGDDTAGGYSLSFLNVSTGPLTNGSDTDGGPIASNEIRNGTFQDPVDFDAFTFSAFAGNRVFVSAIATGGSANTTLTLYPTAGGVAETYTSSGDVIDWQCLTSGSYTVVVEDYSDAHTGTYTLSFLNLTAGPLTGGGDPDGGAMNSSDVKSGTVSGAGDFDVFTFQGTFGDRVVLDAIATAGASFNTVIVLYPPNGVAYATYTTGDRLEYQLNASGTWSVLIEDNGLDTAGSYQLSFLNVTSGPLKGGGDNDGGAITSDEIKNAQFQQGVDFDAYTFNGTAGQRVLFTALATGGGAQNTTITLYPPGGGTAETYTSSGDVVDWQLLSSGTYTFVVEEYGNDTAGTYTASFVNLTGGPLTSAGDSDGGAFTSAQVKSGTMSGIGDLDAYTFTGTIGDRVIIDAVATAGAGFNTVIVLYPPAGGAYATYTTGDRLEFQLTATGTWTILIEDNGNDTAGNYDFSLLDVTSGPHTSGSDADGSVFVSNTIKNGQFNQGVDLDAYTFAGTAGQRIILTGVAVGGGSHNTNLTLYPPDGGPYETTTSADAIDWQLVKTGTYTLVVEDYGDDNAGAYTLSYLNLAAGPLTDGADPDGGAIASADVKTGSISGVGDLDAFTFTGTFGQRVLIDAVATGGASFNTSITLYRPNGGAYATYTSGDRLEFQLDASGTWTIVINDNAFDSPGNYELSVLNVTGGPITTGSDLDGGPILSNEIKNGQFNQGVDFDAYTFTGVAGQRVVFTAVATGASNNTNMTLYPPGGITNEGTTSADQMEVLLQRSGTYTLVLEDYADDNTGTYTLSYLNVTAGPHTSGGDTNGGPIVSNQVVSGTMSGIADLDAYTVNATYGQRFVVDAVATGGAGYNTYFVVYPPNGAGYFTYTSSDRLEFLANASGTWTIVVEDAGNDTAGNYTMSVLNVTVGPYSGSGETDGGPIADNVTKLGSIYSVADADGYTFFGITGMTASITAITTSGLMDTQIALYPPNGVAALVVTTADNTSPILQTDGYYTVVVEDAGADQTGNYSLKVDVSGGVTGVGGDTPPAELALHPGVPSPFSQSTRIDYDLPAPDRVRIGVYDVTGARIRGLVDEQRPSGRFGITWDGRDDSGRRVASGVYYLRMETRAEVRKQKVVLVR